MSRSPLVRFRLFALVAALSALGLCSSASAQITIGQVAPDLESPSSCGGEFGYNEAQRLVASGASYVVPTAGVLTSWSSRTAEPGSLSLAVYRPVAGKFLVLAQDGPRLLAPNSLSTFPVSIPVLAGDLIGTAVPALAPSECLFLTGLLGDEIMYESGNAPVGGTVTMVEGEENRRINVSATLLPPPTIAAISPASGSIKGGKVTIAGANFASVSAVSFGSVPATSFTVDSEGQITATAPASKTLSKVPVTVTTVAGAVASAQTYAYEGCKVPQLKGKKLKASKKKARKSDCKIGKVTKRDGATAKTGEVVKQNPKPGKTLVPGTKIKVTLEP